MGLDIRQGSFACAAATGDQVVSFSSAMSQTPSVLLFWASLLTAAGTGANATYSIGAATTILTNVSGGLNATDNVATSASARAEAPGNVLALPNAAGSAFSLQGALASLTASSFTINWTNVTTNAVIHYLALAGTDITNSISSRQTIASGTTGTVSVTTPAFQPDVVLFFYCGSGGSAEAAVAQGCIGAAASSTARWVNAMTYANAQTMSTSQFGKHYFRSDRCLAAFGSSSTIVFEADFLGMTASGFQLNVVANTLGATCTIDYLAIQGLRAAVGTASHAGGAASGSVTGLAFPPAAVLLGTGGSAVSTSVAAGAYLGFGASNFTNAGSVCVAGQDATINTAADTATRTTSAIEQWTEASSVGTSQATMGVPTATASGFSYSWGGTVTNAWDFGYLALGAAAVAAQDTPELYGRPFGLLGAQQMQQLLAQ